MNSFVRLGFFPPGYSFGLLVLRVCFGLTLFWCHGLPKIMGFSQMSQHFADPLHIGVRTTLIGAGVLGAVVTLAFLYLPGMRDAGADVDQARRGRHRPERVHAELLKAAA